MESKTLLAGAALAVLCSTIPLRGDVLQIVNLTMTTCSQGATSDDGTVAVTPAPRVKIYNTQALLNLLAQDKQAEGQWSASVFPARSKLAMTNDAFVVVDSANAVLADVSDILTVAGGVNAITSGRQSDATLLASPAAATKEVIAILFDDTAIAGGNNTSFYVQGVSTRTVTDSKPTSAGVYTETRTSKLTAAAGEGTWSDGTPFVCTATLTASGRVTFGQTNAKDGFAPASLEGYAAAVKFTGQPVIDVIWGQSTWGQAGTGSDTNADNYCAGAYTYVKTGPNTAHVTSSDIGMLSWLDTSNFTLTDITFTSPTTARCTMTGPDWTAKPTLTFSLVTNLVPASVAGKTVQLYLSTGAAESAITFNNDGTFTQNETGRGPGSGTYTSTQYSPTVAIFRLAYTDANNTGAVAYAEVIFSSATAGRVFHSHYQSPAYGSNPDDSGVGTFEITN